MEPRINDREFLCLFISSSSVLLPRDGSINYTADNDGARRGEFFLKIYSVNNSPRSVIYDFRISHAGWIRVRRRIQHPEKRLVDRTSADGRGNGIIFRVRISGPVIRASISHA